MIVADSDPSIRVTFNGMVTVKRIRKRSNREFHWYTETEIRQFRKDYEYHKATQQRISMVRSDPSIRVTFNEIVKTKRIRKRSNRESHWYTETEIRQFREDYRSHEATQQRIIRQQQIREKFGTAWKSLPLSSIFRKQTT